MANSVTMTYGDYSFIPVPFINLTKEYLRSGDGQSVGTTFKLSLEGTVTPIPTGLGGYENVDALQDALREALNEDGKQFSVECDGNVLIRSHPTILNISFPPSTNNWVQTSAYTIDLEFADEPTGSGNDFSLMPPYLQSASEDWSLEFMGDKSFYTWSLDGTPDANPYALTLSHNVNAVGIRHYSSDGGTGGTLDMEAWEQARNWVVPRLGFDSTQLDSSGVLNLDASLFHEYNHVRTQQTDEMGGSFGVAESWVVINPSGTGVAGRATEDFTIDVRTGIEDGFTTIGINGTIQGLESVNYGSVPGDYAVTETKYAAAEDYWSNVSTKLLGRAQKVGDATAVREINSTPKAQSVGHSPPAGQITYQYEYDDRPCNFIDGASTENITVADNHPTDMFAKLTVLGRANGPLLQHLSTVTESTRDVSIEVTIAPPTGCDTSTDVPALLAARPTTEVEALLCAFEGELTSAYSQVFKTKDTDNWNPKNGRYSRQASWIYTNCTGVAPATSFC